MKPIRLTKFKLGELAATHSVYESVPPDEIRAAVLRHADGDWGEACPFLRKLNDRALERGERIVSVYRSSCDAEFWIVTEWDRSMTTVLFPKEF